MNIIIDYQDAETDLEQLNVVAAKYLTDYVIRVKFSDGTEQVVDFKSFLRRSLHPAIQKYQDEALFADFAIMDGNLNWNDYELIFPVADLYAGKI